MNDPVMMEYDAVAAHQSILKIAEALANSKQEKADIEHDPVNHPKHYTSHPSGVECIQITRHMSFNLGNVVKYLWRAGLKDSEITNKELEDLKKARFYLDDEIQKKEKELLDK